MFAYRFQAVAGSKWDHTFSSRKFDSLETGALESLLFNLPCTFVHVMGNHSFSISSFCVLCVWRNLLRCGVQVQEIGVIGQNESHQPEEAKGNALKYKDDLRCLGWVILSLRA